MGKQCAPLILGVSTLLCGCAMGGFVTVSEPSLLTESKAYALEEATSVFRIGDATFSVKPQNADVSLLTAGVIVPVVPLGSGNKVRADKPFQLIVQFQHSGGAYSFVPMSTTLITKTGAALPVSMLGPLTRTDFPRELEKTSFGHPWVCRDQGKSVKVETSTEVVIPPKSCFVLEFASLTLSPQNEFAVEVGGLKKEGRPLPKIGIQFKPTQRAAGSWLGSQ